MVDGRSTVGVTDGISVVAVVEFLIGLGVEDDDW